MWWLKPIVNERIYVSGVLPTESIFPFRNMKLVAPWKNN
jgi:hypothetical protein